jgi:hypothetical protein
MQRDSDFRAGEIHNEMIRATSDTVHGFKILPSLMRAMLENDGWRRLVRPIDSQVFTHETVASWVLGEPWAGLNFPSWDALYAVLDRADGGKAVRAMLVERGAPANGLAGDTRASRGGPGRPPAGTKNMGNSHITGGKDTRSTIARLKRDNPDLAEQVIRGELSANAAAIKAGFRKRTISVPLDPNGWAEATLRHFTPEQAYAIAQVLLMKTKGAA